MRPLTIALTVDPYLPVPPRLYGGIERVVDFLARGLVERGHRVILLAHPESATAGELVPYGRPPHRGATARLTELVQAGGALMRRRAQIDLVHSFGRLAALLPLLPLSGLAKIQSYQRDRVPWASVAVAQRLAGRSLLFTGCSSSVYRRRPEGPRGGRWHTVFNGVDLDRYPPRVEMPPGDAPLVFLGRIEAIKGTHHALDIAERAGRRLVIAGNRVDDPDGERYFVTAVAPRLAAGRAEYVGPVDDAAKAELLGGAAALLMPIDWEEPFGIVMAEAMACGTPVIAYPRGSVPEVVRHGLNGFVASGVDEAAALVGRLEEIDRRAVRADCAERFSHTAVVDAYEALYRELSEGELSEGELGEGELGEGELGEGELGEGEP